MARKNKLVWVFLAVASLLFFRSVRAQESYPMVDYHNQPVVDSDSDGLTDQGESQIYNTDSSKADTDGDTYSDGVEVIAGTNPLDANSYPGSLIPISQTRAPQTETPWAWYASRASALVAFALLYVAIFLGLTLRIPALRKIIAPIYSMRFHRWISLQATVLALFHGSVLMLDNFFNIRFKDIFIPFASTFQPGLMALGIFGFYLMVILVATSYGRRYISQKVWRGVHLLNAVLYVIVLLHAAQLGTDMKNPLVFGIFLWANAFLVVIILWNIELRLVEALKRRKNVLE
jgi:DMSO/TMAO reductase YedYZ heme-binding membrane subunit